MMESCVGGRAWVRVAGMHEYASVCDEHERLEDVARASRGGSKGSS